MSMFIEVESVEKKCKVIVNLDDVVEIAPWASGGTVLFFADSSTIGGVRSYRVTDSYTLFKQFALQQVSAEDIARRFDNKVYKTQTQEAQKQEGSVNKNQVGPGVTPKKTVDIPKL